MTSSRRCVHFSRYRTLRNKRCWDSWLHLYSNYPVFTSAMQGKCDKKVDCRAFMKVFSLRVRAQSKILDLSPSKHSLGTLVHQLLQMDLQVLPQHQSSVLHIR